MKKKNIKISTVFVTIDTHKNATELALELLKRKLAACINILKLNRSIYKWKGKICNDQEYLLIIKTGTSILNKLYIFIQKNHPYSVPEIITLEVSKVNRSYSKWVIDSIA
ncbi:MAG: divalent-cation tolerance protein CutA [Planctomycetes bacterium]|nr:divalent-cation tolerance protein CutA [Planctomycetota bacterium]